MNQLASQQTEPYVSKWNMPGNCVPITKIALLSALASSYPSVIASDGASLYGATWIFGDCIFCRHQSLLNNGTKAFKLDTNQPEYYMDVHVSLVIWLYERGWVVIPQQVGFQIWPGNGLDFNGRALIESVPIAQLKNRDIEE